MAFKLHQPCDKGWFHIPALPTSPPRISLFFLVCSWLCMLKSEPVCSFSNLAFCASICIYWSSDMEHNWKAVGAIFPHLDYRFSLSQHHKLTCCFLCQWLCKRQAIIRKLILPFCSSKVRGQWVVVSSTYCKSYQTKNTKRNSVCWKISFTRRLSNSHLWKNML